jgi:hypothetical protein
MKQPLHRVPVEATDDDGTCGRQVPSSQILLGWTEVRSLGFFVFQRLFGWQ